MTRVNLIQDKHDKSSESSSHPQETRAVELYVSAFFAAVLLSIIALPILHA